MQLAALASRSAPWRTAGRRAGRARSMTVAEVLEVPFGLHARQVDLPAVARSRRRRRAGWADRAWRNRGMVVDVVELAGDDAGRERPHARRQQRHVDDRALARCARAGRARRAMPPARNAPAVRSPSAGPGWGTNSSDTMLAAWPMPVRAQKSVWSKPPVLRLGARRPRGRSPGRTRASGSRREQVVGVDARSAAARRAAGW